MPAGLSSCPADYPPARSARPRQPTGCAATIPETATLMASPLVGARPPWPPTLDSLAGSAAARSPSGPTTRHLRSLPGAESLTASEPGQLPKAPPDWAPSVEPLSVEPLLADPPSVSPRRTGNIADSFADLLKPLSRQRRRGLIAQLSIGFYEGWRPGREEIADLVAVELGTLTIDDSLERQRRRTREQRAALRRRAL